MPAIVVTGSASGIGRATAERLQRAGRRVLTVDRHDAEVVADLGDPSGRRFAVERIHAASGGRIDGVVTSAGVAGLDGRPGSVVVGINYFGTVELLSALQPLLAHGVHPAAVAITSNAATTLPGVAQELSNVCLTGDERGARALADEIGSLRAYPAVKLALGRWVRRNAPSDAWAGQGIRLNAVAPGMVDTAMNAEGRRDPAKAAALASFPLPVGRMGRPEEIAAVIDLLLGPDGGYFCGSVLVVDGGTEALLRADDWPVPLPPA